MALSTLLLLAGVQAKATVRPPVDVRLGGDPRAAATGELFTGELRIESGREATVTNIRLEGSLWREVSLDAPGEILLMEGEGIDVPFAALPGDAERPLIVAFEWNGITVRRSIDLSEKSARMAREGIPVVAVEGEGGESPVVFGAAAVRPGPFVLEGEAGPSEKSGDPSKRHTIRVRGRFAYQRPDTTLYIGVDGMTLKIYDDDPVGDDYILSAVTDAQGYFDETFFFDDPWEDYPDIYIEFWASNAEHEIQTPGAGIIYKWETGVYEDVTSYLDIGTVQSGDESLVPALHILSDMTRTWRYFDEYGYDCRYLEVEWPDNSSNGGAWYTGYSEEIHISSEREWNEATHSHEYGHHWVNCFSTLTDPDYCNGICDTPDCGHCIWCEENTTDAWAEGFPDYLGRMIPIEYESRYGLEASRIYALDSLDTCDDDGTYDDPLITEGFAAAALVDIDDDEEDNDNRFPEYEDQLQMDADEIFACVDSHQPTTVTAFLLDFKADYPSADEALWETAANCGYDIDEAPPGAPSSVWSTSHSTGIPSPDPTISLRWTRPSDDASGAHAYSVLFNPGAPALPNTAEDVFDDLSYVSNVLVPGTYYCCVRARDWVGNWSDDYSWYGPVTIRDPEPANLEFYAQAGWDYPLVPSSQTSNTFGSTTVSDSLIGYVSSYWSVTGRNVGESATSEDVVGHIYLDGSQLYSDNFGIVGGNDSFYVCNSGPFVGRGGRHVFHYMLDSPEQIAETNELDNTWGHQFVWTPQKLTPGVIESEAWFSHALAGWEHVVDGSPLYWNCRGVRFDNSAWWNAVVTWAADNGENFDTRLHLVSTGAENGYAVPLVTSYRAAGCLDALIVNRNAVATAAYDVGIVWYGVGSAGPCNAVHLETDACSVGSPASTTTGVDDWFKMYEFYVYDYQVGSISAIVQTDQPSIPHYVQWRSEDFVTGGLLDYDAQVVTDEEGKAHLQFDVTSQGYNSLVIFRDPKDGDTTATVDFEVEPTPPDLTPYYAAGWHSPMVPRPAADGTPTSVPLPDTLIGNAASTYYNLAFQNQTAGSAESLYAFVWLDGAMDAPILYPDFPPFATSRYNYPAVQIVRGGRHTLALWIDSYDSVEETDEGNNHYGEQYCWSPLHMMPGSGIVRSAPPERTGGWDRIESGEAKWYNCDGFRIWLNGMTPWWAAMAVMPGDTSNVDLRIHDPLTGVKDGFAANHVLSGWGPGASDYVIVNFNNVARGDFDVGVLSVSGQEGYVAQCADETYLGTPDGVYGPYTMGANQILDLYELDLLPGQLTITLADVDNHVDWGLSLHPASGDFLRKSDVVGGGASWYNGVGEDETLSVSIDSAGYYCLAIWKVGSADLDQSGMYKLWFQAVSTGVTAAGGIPAVTAFRGVYPNPFNPQTTIAFDLATAERVHVAVYNLSGALVRTLVEESRPPGRYTIAWDGTDGAGRQLSSGLYFARVSAGEMVEAKKIVLLK